MGMNKKTSDYRMLEVYWRYIEAYCKGVPIEDLDEYDKFVLEQHEKLKKKCEKAERI